MEFSPIEKKALFIVEGAKREVKLVEKMTKLVDIPMKVFSACANIHMLYQSLKKWEFNFNIIDALLSLPGVSDKDKQMLREEKKFAYIYLIFDLDLQHYDISEQDNIVRGLTEVQEMVDYFCDETDPTIGKIYINYPMVESYRDCKSFFDDDYKDTTIKLAQITSYKDIVNKRGMQKNLGKYRKEDFFNLAKMNIQKGNYICLSAWEKPSYEVYTKTVSQENILQKESKMIADNKIISVINSCFFILVDYFGNRDSFYDSL